MQTCPPPCHDPRRAGDDAASWAEAQARWAASFTHSVDCRAPSGAQAVACAARVGPSGAGRSPSGPARVSSHCVQAGSALQPACAVDDASVWPPASSSGPADEERVLRAPSVRAHSSGRIVQGPWLGECRSCEFTGHLTSNGQCWRCRAADAEADMAMAEQVEYV